MANNRFYTADPHFDHENILEYAFRPFRDVNQMNHTLIVNYNLEMDENDILYFIGDVSLTKHPEKLARYLRKIRARKVLVLGNHDEMKPFRYIEIGFESVHTSLEVNGRILVHDPAVASLRPDTTFVTGHVHNLFLKTKNAINVGVDVHAFKPVSEARLLELEGMGPFLPDPLGRQYTGRRHR